MPAFVQVDGTCWDDTLSTFEQRLTRPFPLYALEQLRLRFLHAVTTTHDTRKGARAVLQMALETELSTTLMKLVVVAPDVMTSRICERRRFLEIDEDVQRYGFLLAPALDALADTNTLPRPYADLVAKHLTTKYPRYRVCAVAALLCLAAYYLIEDL